jgi:hypothetical protein
MSMCWNTITRPPDSAGSATTCLYLGHNYLKEFTKSLLHRFTNNYTRYLCFPGRLLCRSTLGNHSLIPKFAKQGCHLCIQFYYKLHASGRSTYSREQQTPSYEGMYPLVYLLWVEDSRHSVKDLNKLTENERKRSRVAKSLELQLSAFVHDWASYNSVNDTVSVFVHQAEGRKFKSLQLEVEGTKLTPRILIRTC